MFEERIADLGNFITKDPKGQQVPKYLKMLGKQLAEQNASLLEEITSLAKNIDHVKDIVAMRQMLRPSLDCGRNGESHGPGRRLITHE